MQYIFSENFNYILLQVKGIISMLHPDYATIFWLKEGDGQLLWNEFLNHFLRIRTALFYVQNRLES